MTSVRFLHVVLCLVIVRPFLVPAPLPPVATSVLSFVISFDHVLRTVQFHLRHSATDSPCSYISSAVRVVSPQHCPNITPRFTPF
ncbi:uncharacterized protein F5147DRAFT_719297 [Suillus discolor]|uniref:Secreted protein n=1 Tax=Suillus discolor TaxID=1912936 RepID=A0A9P7JP63_9AGAM|nr:uncharacterized protein F5147DRAFT_719297 [Suillus discolor]KAG2094854.1 hypothetical protein F5147DRAFT_719297 [Suillus discolor]